MTMFLLRIIVLLAAFAIPVHAQEPSRIALIIGNQGYTAKVGPLKNTHNDVYLIEASLKKLGFKVTVLRDGTSKDMNSAISRHVREVGRAGAGAISFFFYSGHGVANPETKVNHLIPIDVADAEDEKIWDEGVQQNAVIDLLSKQAPRATHFVVFDACRSELQITGPAAKALGSEKGFVPIESPAGLLIAYSTAPNKAATDASAGGSPYAKALAEELVKPGVEAVAMFRTIQVGMKQATGQDPWLSFHSVPPIYLAGPEVADGANAPRTMQPPTQQPLSEAAQVWRDIQAHSDPAVIEAFRKQYGAANPVYDTLAASRLAEIARARTHEISVAPPAQQPLVAQPTQDSEGAPQSAAIPDVNWPTQTVNLIVPFAVGTATDVIGRQVARTLASSLKQSIIVENKGGASGSIGAQTVARAQPHGASFLLGTLNTQVTIPLLLRPSPYDGVKDFTPVAMIGETPSVVLTHSSLAARNLSDLKAEKNLYFGTSGTGSTGHLACEQLNGEMRIQTRQVPFSGAAAPLAALVAKQVSLICAPLNTSILDQIRTGKIKALATLAAKRSPALPEIATAREQNVSAEAVDWLAIFAPKGLSPGIAAKFNAAIVRALKDSELKTTIEQIGFAIPQGEGATPDGLASIVRNDTDKWRSVITSRGIKSY